MEDIRGQALALLLSIATVLFGAAQAERWQDTEAGMTQNETDPDYAYISITPDPPVAGQSATICYDFENSGETGTVKLQVTWTMADGTEQSETIKVDPTDPCEQVDVDKDARFLNVQDLTGGSVDLGRVVSVEDD